MKKKWSILLLVMIMLLCCGCGAKSADHAEVCELEPAEMQMNGAYSMERSAGSGDMETWQETPEAGSVESEPLICIVFSQYSDSVAADDGTKLFVSQANVPEIVTEEDALNRWLASAVQSAADETADDLRLVAQIAEEDYRASAGEEGIGFYAYSYYSDVSVERLDDHVISFLQVNSVYSGGAHPNYAQEAYNLDLNGQMLLSLDDVILPGGVSLLQQQVLEQLLQRFGGLENSGLYGDYAEIVKSHFREDSPTPNWYFSVNGLVVYFNCYDIAPYAAGIIKVEFPYETLGSILRPEYHPEREASVGTVMLLDSVEGRSVLNPSTEGECRYVSVDQTVYDVKIYRLTGWLTDKIPMVGQMVLAANRLTAAEAVSIPVTNEYGCLMIYRSGADQVHQLAIDSSEIREIITETAE